LVRQKLPPQARQKKFDFTKKIFDTKEMTILSSDFDFNSKVYMDFLMKNKTLSWLVVSGEGSYEIPFAGIYNEV
jgi:hypothetical protein